MPPIPRDLQPLLAIAPGLVEQIRAGTRHAPEGSPRTRSRRTAKSTAGWEAPGEFRPDRFCPGTEARSTSSRRAVETMS
jgi:hypothetical protein